MNPAPRRHNLQIEHLPTSELIPNSRRHSRKQINKLSKIIYKLGFSVPIVVDETGTILAGHGRLRAAMQLGLAGVPCIRLRDLSEPEKLAFLVADNRVADESTFDDAAIKGLLIELAGLEFDPTLTGFDPGEIDFRIDGAAGVVLGDPADQPPPGPTGAPPVSQTGDLWQLGKHRLLCGSALDEASYRIALKGELAQMVFTDSPRPVPINGHVFGLGKHKHPEWASTCGEMSAAQFRDKFLAPAHTLMAAHSIDGSIHFACIDWRHTADLMAAWEKIYSEVKNICVWVKRSGSMGSLYRSEHEFVIVFKKGAAPHINNVQLGRHGRNRSNAWHYPGPNSFGPTRDADLKNHHTVKPVALVADAIRDCSERGGLTLDPFSDSGTTILAAERTGRRAAGIEIETAFVDVAIRRWQVLTSLEAVLASNGQAFTQIEQLRLTSRDPAERGAA